MRSMLKSVAALALAVLVAAPLSAAEDAAKKPKEPNKAVTSVFALPDTITLTDEQKTKLADVKKEFETKLTDVLKKKNDILTAEQKKAGAEATKAAKAAGKKGKELQADITAALKLTDEQKKKQEEVNKELKELTAQIKEKIGSCLTADQKALLMEKKKKPA